MPTTSNFGWTTPADTDLVKDGALAIRTLGNGIDTSFIDLKGGTTGQNLRKASNTDLDFTFAGDETNTVIDAEGDLLVGDSADTLQRLAIGTTGQVLTVDTTLDGKIKWATAAGGGKVLQVVQDTDTSNFTTTSATFVDTGLSVTITPSSATSKVLVIASMPYAYAGNPNSGDFVCYFNLVRGATQLCEGGLGSYGLLGQSAASPSGYGAFTMMTLDSPATTSATTYKVQAKKGEGQAAYYNGSATRINSIVAMEIGA